MNIDEIKPANYNPRLDLQAGDKEYEKIKRSITEFGLVEPIVWNEKSGNIVGGHQRYKVLKDLGYEDISVSVVNLNDNEEKALNIALNKISGDWDNAKLKDLLEELDVGDFDIELTGFDFDELEDLMTEFHVEDSEDSEEEERELLIERFIVPPFSILDTRLGYWLNRRKSWLNLGIKSEVGRGADDDKSKEGLLFNVSSQPPEVYDKKNAYEKKIGHTVSME